MRYPGTYWQHLYWGGRYFAQCGGTGSAKREAAVPAAPAHTAVIVTNRTKSSISALRYYCRDAVLLRYSGEKHNLLSVHKIVRFVFAILWYN